MIGSPASHQLVLLRDGAERARVAVWGAMTVGGSRRDAIFVSGLPPSALLVRPLPSGLLIEARTEGMRAAGEPLGAGDRWLLRGGERVDVAGHALELLRRPPPEGPHALAGLVLRRAAEGDRVLLEPHLLVLAGVQAGCRFPLASDERLGRGARASIRIDDPRTSRVHARLWSAGGRFWIRDLASKNGVVVNGTSLGRRRRGLAPGDRIRLGGTLLALEGSLLESAGAAPSAPELPARPRWSRRATGLATAATLLLLGAACAAFFIAD